MQVLGQGGLFRQLVQVLRDNGGVVGLKTIRVEAATTTVLKQLRPAESKTTADGNTLVASDRFGGLATTTLSPTPTPSEPVLDPVPEGKPGPDWSWWRERSVLLALSLLDAAAERERGFVEQWRARVTAGCLDDDDDFAAAPTFIGAGGGGGGGVGRGGGGGVKRGGGGGSLAAPTYLGHLLSEGNTIAAVARFVRVGGRFLWLWFFVTYVVGVKGGEVGGWVGRIPLIWIIGQLKLSYRRVEVRSL